MSDEVSDIYSLQFITMSKKDLELLVLEQRILNRIYIFRGEKVMLDRDLAELYGVETKVLNQSLKRNKERFPKDLCFY